MIPLYGFLEGDCLGLLILAEETESVGQLSDRLVKSASVRVAPRERPSLVFKGRRVDRLSLVRQVGFQALDRFDVVWKEE
jgi:hypothetical protein